MDELSEAIGIFRSIDEWGERAREGIQAIVKKYARPVGTMAAKKAAAAKASAPCPKGTTRIGAHCHGDTGRTKKPRKPRKPKIRVKPKAPAHSAPPMGVTRKLFDPAARAAKPKAASSGSALARRPLASVKSISRVGGVKKAKMSFVAPTRKAAARKPVGVHPTTGAPHDRFSALLAKRRKQKGRSARPSGKVAV